MQPEAARRAGSLADNTEVDVESGGDRASGYRKLNDEKLIEPQREPRARRDIRSIFLVRTSALRSLTSLSLPAAAAASKRLIVNYLTGELKSLEPQAPHEA